MSHPHLTRKNRKQKEKSQKQDLEGFTEQFSKNQDTKIDLSQQHFTEVQPGELAYAEYVDQPDRITKEEEASDNVITSYIPSYQSDSTLGEDKLDILHEVDAFKQLILSKRLTPPLSIGLVGNWGTGKSFFMNKLAERIKEKPLGLAVSEYEKHYCQNVVQIKFNAWYYVDSNLWASIVSKIFEGIGQEAKLMVDESEEAIMKLSQEISSLKEIKASANDELQSLKKQEKLLDDSIKKLEKKAQSTKKKL